MKLKDIDKVDAWSPSSMLEVGWHNVRIERIDEGTTKNNNPQLEITLANEQGDIRDWLVNVEATRGKIKQLLEAAQVKIEPGEWEFNPQSLVGKPVRVKVGNEPDYNDPTKTRRRVQGYTPPSDIPADDSDIPF